MYSAAVYSRVTVHTRRLVGGWLCLFILCFSYFYYLLAPLTRLLYGTESLVVQSTEYTHTLDIFTLTSLFTHLYAISVSTTFYRSDHGGPPLAGSGTWDHLRWLNLQKKVGRGTLDLELSLDSYSGAPRGPRASPGPQLGLQRNVTNLLKQGSMENRGYINFIKSEMFYFAIFIRHRLCLEDHCCHARCAAPPSERPVHATLGGSERAPGRRTRSRTSGGLA